MIEQFYLHSTSGRPKLKIGLLLDGFIQPAWIASILSHIQKCNFAYIDFIILNGKEQNAEPPPRLPLPRRIIDRLKDKNRRKRLLYAMYTKAESRQFNSPNSPMSSVDCTAALSRADTITVEPLTKGFVQRFRPEDIERIKERNLDVILRFGFNIIRGEILQVAQYGVWSYHHGDNDWYRGGPSHFWEMYENHPVSGVLLQVLSDELDGGIVLCKSWIATQSSLWVTANRVQPYWTGSFFVIRKLHELHQYGWEFVKSRCIPNRFVEGRNKIYRTPDNGAMARFLAPRVLRRAQIASRGERVYHWRMAFRARSGWRPGESLSTGGFQWFEAPRGHFWADPFIWEHNGKTWLFFEDFLYSENRGVISCAELSRDGRLGEAVRVLDLPYHLSFPLIFEHEGEIYMIPETGWNQTVELWRATTFPFKWKKEHILFEGVHAFDTVLWRHNGLFWWFVTLYDPREAGPQLFLFYSSSLTGKWIYHRANPICSDERNARCAGAIFMRDGHLYRPSQNGSPRYGYACNMNEIIRLTTSEYEERTVATLEPTPTMAGVHTYNSGSWLEVIDGQWISPKSAHL